MKIYGTSFILTAALLLLASDARSVEYPTRATSTQRGYATNQATGYVRATIGSSAWRGSGVVARHQQLLYSCAHVIWDNGQWAPASGIQFNRAYNSQSRPANGSGQGVRGFRYFTAYSSSASQQKNSNRTFSSDFVIMYANSSLGSATAYYATDGGNAVLSNRSKKLVGYPSTIKYTGDPGYYYQHNTNYFTTRASQTYGDYFRFNGVGSGGGNSGGPLFVRGTNGVWGLAAIWISGLPDGTRGGVRVLDDASYSMGTNALETLGGSPRIVKKFSNRKKLNLPDGSSRYKFRSVNANGFIGHVHSIKFKTTITTSYRADLDVFLKSPKGRITWISRDSGGSANHLKVNRNLSGRLKGQVANGTWRLYMRDDAKGDRSAFRNFSLSISD